MNRTLVLLSVLAPLAQGAINVGVFDAEMKHTFTTAQGLPDDRVRCIATKGLQVYAGTSKGLASYTPGSWRADQRFNQHPVEFYARRLPIRSSSLMTAGSSV